MVGMEIDSKSLVLVWGIFASLYMDAEEGPWTDRSGEMIVEVEGSATTAISNPKLRRLDYSLIDAIGLGRLDSNGLIEVVETVQVDASTRDAIRSIPFANNQFIALRAIDGPVYFVLLTEEFNPVLVLEFWRDDDVFVPYYAEKTGSRYDLKEILFPEIANTDMGAQELKFEVFNSRFVSLPEFSDAVVQSFGKESF